MIVSFRHRGLELLYRKDSLQGVRPDQGAKLRRILAVLDVAAIPADVDLPGYRLHELKGDQNGRWSVRVNGNWRVTFRFVGTDVELLDLEDYH